jgi:hypothetical protein
MSTAEAEKKLALSAVCDKLHDNDRSTVTLDLSRLDMYGKLERNDVKKIVKALESNTRLRGISLMISDDICTDGAGLITHFLKSSPSLRSVNLKHQVGDSPTKDEDAVTTILEALVRSRGLTDLHLDGIVCKRPDLIEMILAATRTLSSLLIVMGGSSVATPPLAQAFRDGLKQNKTLESLGWCSYEAADDSIAGEILFGLSRHWKLRKLVLELNQLDPVVFGELRSFLVANETLEILDVSNCEEEVDDHAGLAWIMLLRGLGSNRGLKHVSLSLPNPNLDCEEAWTEMLQTNVTIETPDLSNSLYFGNESMSAIATGLCGNDSLRKLEFNENMDTDAFVGVAWKEMLQENHSLEELNLSLCYETDDDDGRQSFASFTQGLSVDSRRI